MRSQSTFPAACVTALMMAATAAEGGEAMLQTDRFTFSFDGAGKPASLRARPDDEELLNARDPGAGFYLTGADGQRTPLSDLTMGTDGRLTARSADARSAVVFAVRTTERHVALRIERLDGIPSERGVALHLDINATPRLRVTELDYMTSVENTGRGVRVHWKYLWHRSPDNPLGGVALYVRQDEDDEDETLLRIWVEEKLPHPKTPEVWTLDRARAWVAEWQRTFADRSQMILEGGNIEELRAGVQWAEKARIKEIYLFTQTWRTDNFWPADHGNVHVNRKVFPRGEEDLCAFSEFVRSQGMRLNFHYVSGGVGPGDPVYVGSRPDRRLASWGQGTIPNAISAEEKNIPFKPAAGVVWPPPLEGSFFNIDWVRIDDEIVRVGAFEQTEGATWLLRNCARGQFKTRAAAHPQDTEAAGLISAYGQNFVPDNDSTLLDEIARGYARLINLCASGNTEYDGAEIHCYNGRWGYHKFATRVYEQLDHPVTAHDSSGGSPSCYFEYRLNSTQRILRGRCPFTHGNWSAPVQLASPSRVASTLLDANFVLSQGHFGGAMGLCKPEPMFAVSDRSLRAHGLTDRVIATLLDWKAVSGLLSDEQHATIDASFGKPDRRGPEGSRHVVSRFVQTLRKTANGYAIVPVCVLTRKSGDILWQQGQEHGALSPRQYVKPGEELSLENPFAEQPTTFIVRVLWAFDPQGPSVPMQDARGKPASAIRASDLFTAGNVGPSSGQTRAAPNLMLQPAFKDIRVPATAPVKTTVIDEEGALRLKAENAGAEAAWELNQLPEWNCGVDMTASRGIGMRVTGDGSGAILLFQIPGRDYVLPIDFTGPRDIEIPNGEVAWADGRWGWRMKTKSANYEHIAWCKLGFAYLPPGGKTSVRIEGLQALGEIPATLENPVIRTGDGTLTVKGAVASGQYLCYEGGETAGVFDENWVKLHNLPVEKRDYVMPSGWAPVSIRAECPRGAPWLDVQFMTEGEPMYVPAEASARGDQHGHDGR